MMSPEAAAYRSEAGLMALYAVREYMTDPGGDRLQELLTERTLMLASGAIDVIATMSHVVVMSQDHEKALKWINRLIADFEAGEL